MGAASLLQIEPVVVVLEHRSEEPEDSQGGGETGSPEGKPSEISLFLSPPRLLASL